MLGASTDMMGDSETHAGDGVPVLLDPILLRGPLPDFPKAVTFAGVHAERCQDLLACLGEVPRRALGVGACIRQTGRRLQGPEGRACLPDSVQTEHPEL